MVRTRRGADTLGGRAHGSVTTLIQASVLGIAGGIVQVANGDLLVLSMTAIWRIQGGRISLVAGDKRNSDEYQDYVNGAGNAARFAILGDPAIANDGRLLVPDHGNGCVRAVNLMSGMVTTFAGRAYLYDSDDSSDDDEDVPLLVRPAAVISLGDGSFAVSCMDHTIHRVSEDGIISQLVGRGGEHGFANGTGSDARFYLPDSMALESEGTFLVVDSGNHCIRRVDPRTATVTTAAGVPFDFLTRRGEQCGAKILDKNGPSAVWFGDISAIAVAKDGTIYVSEDWSGIREICPITLVDIDLAGNQIADEVVRDGTGATASFVCPSGLCLDESNRQLFVTDSDCVRVIAIQNSVDRRAYRRAPLMCLRKYIQSQAPVLPEGPLSGGVQEPLVRAALRFVFTSCPDGPYSLVLRFLVV